MATAADADGPVSFDVDIEDGRTTIVVTGTDDAAVVVRSAGGERVYLPPERDGDGGGGGGEGDGSYQPAGSDDSPYEGVTAESPYEGIPADSPYDGVREQPDTVGLTRTADGFRIVHDEPATDVRLLR